MSPEPTIRLAVDASNPGQFFACCGLLELADRLWDGAEGWFAANDTEFCIRDGDQNELFNQIAGAQLVAIDPDDDKRTAIMISDPFALNLDWWREGNRLSEALKIWAGSMSNIRIAIAMHAAINECSDRAAPFDHSQVVFDPTSPKKKVEPFYYDARRGGYSQAIDIGFSPNDQKMKTTAFPVVEFLAIVGLQRFRPRQTDGWRQYVYATWDSPLTSCVAQVAAVGEFAVSHKYRFHVGKRSKDHSCFCPAIRMETHHEQA